MRRREDEEEEKKKKREREREREEKVNSTLGGNNQQPGWMGCLSRLHLCLRQIHIYIPRTMASTKHCFRK